MLNVDLLFAHSQQAGKIDFSAGAARDLPDAGARLPVRPSKNEFRLLNL
jgi:hypothetical protein